jgi:RluA family pseudouridine synthase
MSEEIEVPVIWCDESLLVINKPAGLLTLPDGYDPNVPHLKIVLAPEYDPLWIVHRLDRQTSGVIVLARNASAHRNLNTQFQDRRVTKIYHALVAGSPDWDHKTADLPLRVNIGRRHRTVVDHRKGKSSITKFKVLERFGGDCLLEASPLSGRRHQIRVHLAVQGLPIIGDDLYGNDDQVPKSNLDNSLQGFTQSERLLLHRTGLHAKSIQLSHPVSNQLSLFEAPYPEDFSRALESLRGRQD